MSRRNRDEICRLMVAEVIAQHLKKTVPNEYSSNYPTRFSDALMQGFSTATRAPAGWDPDTHITDFATILFGLTGKTFTELADILKSEKKHWNGRHDNMFLKMLIHYFETRNVLLGAR